MKPFLLIALVVFSVPMFIQCSFEKSTMQLVITTQICRHSSPSPIIEGVLIGDINDWLRQVRNLMLYLNLTSVDK